jgi:hypothetical protein
MEQNRNRRSEQSGMNERSSNQSQQLQKNESLQEGSASSVADYGRSQNLEERHGTNSGRQGNSSIPTQSEDTLGNP